MVGQKVVHTVPVRANRNTRDRVRSRQESFHERMQEPDAKGNGANNSRGEGGCSEKCRRSLDQLAHNYRKYAGFSLENFSKTNA